MRQAALLVALVALLVTPAAVSVAATPTSSQPATPDGDDLTVVIHLQDDGDARWNVSVLYELDGANETAAFESLLADYRRGADVGPTAEVFRAVAARQEDRLGRAMSVTRVERGGALNRTGNATGRLSLSFTWTNFSVVTNSTIRVENVFDGNWFGRLRAGEQLVIVPPDGYSLNTAVPEGYTVVNGALQWTGPQSFATGPAMTFTESGPTITGPNGGFPWELVTAAVAVALLAGGVALYLWSDRDPLADSPGGERATGEPGESGETAEAERADDTPEESGAGADEGTEAGEGDGADEGTGADGELLSDEERVERLLREHDGRMKQAKIVEETRWSNAKVSQLLSAMADEGRVEKLRIGRENLISLPEENDES